MELETNIEEIKIPARIYISKSATNKLRNLKHFTKLNNNVLCRIAMMMAIQEEDLLNDAKVENTSGQEFTRDLLFGEHIDVYEIMIRQYIVDNNVDLTFSATITALIESGVHKISRAKSLEQLCQLT